MTDVSVIIPVFNRAQTVGRAIDSVLRQNWPDGAIDLIIVDDGSSDDLAGALSKYGSRLRCIRHAQNAGAAAARNTGIASVYSDFIAFLDSDDEWQPEKLSAQISAMRLRAWRASCTAYFLVQDSAADLVSPWNVADSLTCADMVWGCFVSPGSTLVAERKIFDEIGLLDTSLGRLEDWDWLLRYTRHHPLGFISEPLARIHASTHANATPVLAAIEVLRAKHFSSLSQSDRARFAAALDFEKAAALYRAGQYGRALPPLLKSWSRSPLHHPPLRAVLHNMNFM
ncbi:MAG: glycosyltransferase family 2 protein [Xanthobacteraceae bacterium]